MKRPFVAPALVEQATLAQLTLGTLPCSPGSCDNFGGIP